MTSGKIGDWSKSGALYDEWQISAILDELGIEQDSETDAVFMCLCPFHKNTNTPSFAVNKENGTYICFSPACDVHGSLLGLVQKITGLSLFPAKRMIMKHAGNGKSLEKRVEDIFEKRNELPAFDIDIINRMHDDLWGSPAQEYMHNRGFNDETLAHFQIGYSKNKQLVAIPVHDWQGDPVGVIGRTLVGKRFENSENLPTKSTIFNIHRAKRYGERVIVVEAAIDAMLIHQAGFPYVVATCGGFFTESHRQLLNRHFNEIIIMTDFDDYEKNRDLKCRKCENTCLGHNPGQALGLKIQNSMLNKRIRWAATSYGIIYPRGEKDPGGLTPEEIRECINNSISAAEMQIWRNNIPEMAII